MWQFLKRRREEPEIEEEVLAEEEQAPVEENPIAGLRSGALMEVLTLENHLIFVGVLEVLDKGLIQVREESGQFVPQVEYNQKVKLRATKRSEQVMTLYGQVCGSTDEFWRLDRLEAIQTTEKRNFFRQNIRLEAQVRDVQGGKETPCRVLDVSAGGILIRCKETFQEGQQVRLSGVRFLEEEEPFQFTCRIQRAIPAGGKTDYGCQFERLSDKEEDRLMRVILVLQRKALQARRGSGNLR